MKHLHKRGAFAPSAVVELAGREGTPFAPWVFAASGDAAASAASPAVLAAAAAASPAPVSAVVPPASGQPWVQATGSRPAGAGNAPGIGMRRAGGP